MCTLSLASASSLRSFLASWAWRSSAELCREDAVDTRLAVEPWAAKQFKISTHVCIIIYNYIINNAHNYHHRFSYNDESVWRNGGPMVVAMDAVVLQHYEDDCVVVDSELTVVMVTVAQMYHKLSLINENNIKHMYIFCMIILIILYYLVHQHSSPASNSTVRSHLRTIFVTLTDRVFRI